MNELVFGFLIMVLIYILIVFVVILPIKSRECHTQYGEFNPSYGIIQGCMIDYDGKRIPSEILRSIID